MSFYKEYPNRKDWRKPYRDVRRWDGNCRNHGSCSWCTRNRQYHKIKTELAAEEQLRDWDANTSS